MTDPNFIILYVDNPAISAAFYADLLDRQAEQLSPSFAMIALGSGVNLGLWAKHVVEPTATATGGGAEIAIEVSGDQVVTDLHADWSRRGIPVLQAPVSMVFGRTFVVQDPDGHRLRVIAPRGA